MPSESWFDAALSMLCVLAAGMVGQSGGPNISPSGRKTFGNQAECRSVFLIDFFDRIDSVTARRGVRIRRFGPYGVKVARD
jgi:hypothetical protein